MAANPKFAEQLRRARKEYELRHGDITQEQLGEWVAEWLRDPKGYSTAMANKWFGGKGEPSFSVGVAIFSVLGADLAEVARAAYVRREPPVAAKRAEKKPALDSTFTQEDVDRATDSVTGRRAAKKRRGATGD